MLHYLFRQLLDCSVEPKNFICPGSTEEIICVLGSGPIHHCIWEPKMETSNQLSGCLGLISLLFLWQLLCLKKKKREENRFIWFIISGPLFLGKAIPHLESRAEINKCNHDTYLLAFSKPPPLLCKPKLYAQVTVPDINGLAQLESKTNPPRHAQRPTWSRRVLDRTVIYYIQLTFKINQHMAPQGKTVCLSWSGKTPGRPVIQSMSQIFVGVGFWKKASVARWPHHLQKCHRHHCEHERQGLPSTLQKWWIPLLKYISLKLKSEGQIWLLLRQVN